MSRIGKKLDQSSKGIWLLRFTDLYDLEIVRGLLEQEHKVTLFTGNAFIKEPARKILNLDKNSGTVFYNNNNVVRGNEQVKTRTDWNNMEHMYKNLYFALQIMERQERFPGDLLFEERNHLVLKQYEFWSYEMKHRRPQCAIFMDIPHMYYEMVIMGLLEAENIPYLIVGYTPNQSRVLFLEKNLRVTILPGGHCFDEVNKEFLSTAKKKVMRSRDADINTSFVTWPMLFHRIHGFVRLLLKKRAYTDTYTNGYYIKTGLFRTGFSSVLLEDFQELRYTYNAIKLRRYYLKSTSKPLDEKYIYFPLSSGYENTMHPGVSPWNHVSILEFISRNIPENVYIYVKEHPAQFIFRHHQRFARSIEFYRKIKSINNVRFMDLNTNQFDLMSGAVCVIASSMSSTSYQAIALEKNLLYYGPDVLPKEYAANLFDVDLRNIESVAIHESKNPIDSRSKAYHFERGYDGSKDEAISISEKISWWINNQGGE